MPKQIQSKDGFTETYYYKSVKNPRQRKDSDSSKRKGTRRIQGAPVRPSVHFSAENTMVKGGRFFSEIRKQNTEVHYGYFIQHGAESPARTNRQEKEIKGVPTRKRQHSLSLPAGEIILCIENPEDPIKYLLELINEFVKSK